MVHARSRAETDCGGLGCGGLLRSPAQIRMRPASASRAMRSCWPDRGPSNGSLLATGVEVKWVPVADRVQECA